MRIFFAIGVCAMLGASAAPPDTKHDEPAQAAPELTRAISRGAAGQIPQDCRIDVFWWGDTSPRTARIFADGVGFFDSKRQFRLRPRDVAPVIRWFEEAEFATLGEERGEEEGERESEHHDDEERLIGRVSLTLQGMSRTVIQISSDRPNPKLAELARKILDLAERSSKNGVGAESISDALDRIASGALAPQALELTVHRLDERSRTGAGWLMRTCGRTVAIQEESRDHGYHSPRLLNLSDGDYRRFLALVRESHPGDFPITLYAEKYTDFTLNVLGRSKNLQARQFQGMTSETRGAPQKNFDRLIAGIESLHARALAEGQPEPFPAWP